MYAQKLPLSTIPITGSDQTAPAQQSSQQAAPASTIDREPVDGGASSASTQLNAAASSSSSGSAFALPKPTAGGKPPKDHDGTFAAVLYNNPVSGAALVRNVQKALPKTTVYGYASNATEDTLRTLAVNVASKPEQVAVIAEGNFGAGSKALPKDKDLMVALAKSKLFVEFSNAGLDADYEAELKASHGGEYVHFNSNEVANVGNALGEAMAKMHQAQPQ